MTVLELRLARAQDLRGLHLELQAMVGGFDPDAVQVPDIPGLWAEVAGMDRLVSSLKTLLARRMEDARTWQQAGYRSAAEQLAAVAGTSVSSARNLLETSKQIEALPATADAVRAGKLSAAKVEAIASAATVAPEAEAALLSAADAPLAVVRDQCLRAKAVDRDAAHARIKRGRYAREFTDDEGAWNFIARGTPEAGAKFRAAHGPIIDEMFKTARAEDRKEHRDATISAAALTPDGQVRFGVGAGRRCARQPWWPPVLRATRRWSAPTRTMRMSWAGSSTRASRCT